MKTFIATVKKTNLRYRSIMLLYLLATLLTATGVVLMNRISGQMGEAALAEDTGALLGLLWLLTGVMAIRVAGAAGAAVLRAHTSAKAGYELRAHFIRHFLRVPFARIEQVPSGENLSIYSNDIPKAERFVASGIFELAEDFISFVSAFVFLLIISPRFTGISFIAALGMLVLQTALALPLQRYSTRMSEKSAEFNAVVIDSLQNLAAVFSYNLEAYMEKRYMAVYRQFYASMKKFALALAIMAGTMMTLLMSPLIVIFIVLAYAVIGGEMPLADFIAFVTTVIIAAGAVMQLAQNFGRLAEASAGAKRLNDNTGDTHEEEAKNEENRAFIGKDIAFSNVAFAYVAGASKDDTVPSPALESVSFTIPHGSRVAIVGASGSGKSTILKLLLGLYAPASGTITLGNQDITKIAKSELRKHFAYVPQDSFLFPEGIGKNITLAFNGEAHDRERLEKACAQAGILDFINTLPNRFDSVLTEAADNVSGGQRQRIAMARAFYKDAPIILFDEATASLDPATEAAILANFNAITQGKTVIMAAHRPQAIAACDTIILMQNGQVAGIGTHAELVGVSCCLSGVTEATSLPVSSPIYREVFQCEN